jgi:4a-hydroxytetrahydrobiopterin dehydratase
MEELKDLHCYPLKEGTPPMTELEISRYQKRLKTTWQVKDMRTISKEFTFKDYLRGMTFARDVAILAEKENHHPVICINYDHVVVELETHSIMGLSENDFIMAAKIDAI